MASCNSTFQGVGERTVSWRLLPGPRAVTRFWVDNFQQDLKLWQDLDQVFKLWQDSKLTSFPISPCWWRTSCMLMLIDLINIFYCTVAWHIEFIDLIVTYWSSWLQIWTASHMAGFCIPYRSLNFSIGVGLLLSCGPLFACPDWNLWFFQLGFLWFFSLFLHSSAFFEFHAVYSLTFSFFSDVCWLFIHLSLFLKRVFMGHAHVLWWSPWYMGNVLICTLKYN